ncbi:MAG TPA: hypothetical protein VGG20_06745, partial [Thermoanaerobaculia bacterium]
TAYVTIPTGHAEDVLEIPNAALTYTPDLPAEEMDGLYRRFAISQAARASHIGGQQVVWKLAAGGRLEPVAVKTGISDYASTQLVQGDLKAGDLLVTGALTAGADGKGKARTPGQGTTGRPR